MQAIITRFHGPTATKGARISARIKHPHHGTQLIYKPYHHGLSVRDNHREAAFTLVLELQRCDMLDPGTELIGGELGDDYVWILQPAV